MCPFVFLVAASIAACIVAIVCGIHAFMKMEQKSWDKIEKLKSEQEEK